MSAPSNGAAIRCQNCGRRKIHFHSRIEYERCVCRTHCLFTDKSKQFHAFRSEKGSYNMSHAQTSAHCGIIRDVFVGGNALYGFRIVSIHWKRKTWMSHSVTVLFSAWTAPIFVTKSFEGLQQDLFTAKLLQGNNHTLQLNSTK